MRYRWACAAGVGFVLTLGCGALWGQEPKAASPEGARASGGTTTGAVRPGDVEWREMRAARPFHLQVVAATREGEGGRVVVVTEPPPHAELKVMADRAGARAARVKRRRVGYDGFVRDVVMELPMMGAEEFAGRMGDLQRYLFGTTYKGAVYPLPLPKAGPVVKSEYDVGVSDGELKEWLPAGAELLPVNGGAAVTMGEALGGRGGVYLSRGRDFVVWAVPRGEGSDLSVLKAEARQWALDSDLVLGAIAGERCVAIVGRERVTSPLDLPPLRAEEVVQLAAVGHDELAQSYERMNVAAGRFNERDDWAPIYLSDELVDTEYGSLLNITDQLLKSWSMSGTVRYENFRYSEPGVFPFEKPLIEVLGGNVTFNWNTKGAGYVTEDALAVRHTGALPVSYIPGGGEGEADGKGEAARGLEAVGYAYFAGSGDANLARVVQYATLYQIFRTFDVRAAAGARGGGAAADGSGVLTEAVGGVLKKVAGAEGAGMVRLSKEVAGSWG